MRIGVILPVVFLIFFFGSCRKDFDTIPSQGNLEFSKDTVLLNRVFDDISSSTQSFKVYNRSNDDITIPRIALGRGAGSFYRLNVDGIPGKSFDNIDILAKDSIYVFVEATVDFNQLDGADFFYRDSVVFYSDTREQDVKLEALVMDVKLIRPDREEQADGSFVYEEIELAKDAEGQPISVRGSLLPGNTTFTGEKPYLIYGYLGVPEGATLTIEAGSTLYFHNSSGIIVQKNATLNVNGEQEHQVLFEDDRLEPDFEDVAGQWGTIWLRAGSKNNTINYATIKNSIIGILADSISGSTPTLTLTNSQIYNTSNYGLMARESNIKGNNLVIGNNGMSSLACTMGGIYNFAHCTFANYRVNSIGAPALWINNIYKYIDESGTVNILPFDLLEAKFTNCIIEGNDRVELSLEMTDEALFNFDFKNCMLRFESDSTNPLYDFMDETKYQQLVLNGNPDFKDFTTNQYVIGQDSDAIDKADASAALLVPFDILGISRTAAPDIGAYQHIIFEDE
ncbi:MAG: hypothetical protein KDC69_07020 [Flavobacteriaceae bacterium]|nr:hypothetical protein [Flavobacteriaceae bacterium]